MRGKISRRLSMRSITSGSRYKSLENNDEAAPILGLYREILKTRDESVQKTAEALRVLHNSQLIPAVARDNIGKQANQLVAGALEVVKTGTATIPVFGKYTTVHSLKEIEEHLARIKGDLEKAASVPSDYDSFVRNGLPIIDKYIFEPYISETNQRQNPKVVIFESASPFPSADHPATSLFTEQLQQTGILTENATIQRLSPDTEPFRFEKNDVVAMPTERM